MSGRRIVVGGSRNMGCAGIRKRGVLRPLTPQLRRYLILRTYEAPCVFDGFGSRIGISRSAPDNSSPSRVLQLYAV
jgi:hypothetical protein